MQRGTKVSIGQLLALVKIGFVISVEKKLRRSVALTNTLEALKLSTYFQFLKVAHTLGTTSDFPIDHAI